MARSYFCFVETSPAAASTVASSSPVQSAGSNFLQGVAGPMSDYDAVDVIADLQGATGGSLDVYLQISPDDGQNWYDIIHFPTISAGAAVKSYQAPISNSTVTNTPILVGKNLNPALAGGTVVNGAFSDRMRLVFVAGSGTSAGAQQVVRIAPQRAEGNR
jgi:hypothetical protein